MVRKFALKSDICLLESFMDCVSVAATTIEGKLGFVTKKTDRTCGPTLMKSKYPVRCLLPMSGQKADIKSLSL